MMKIVKVIGSFLCEKILKRLGPYFRGKIREDIIAICKVMNDTEKVNQTLLVNFFNN